MSKIELDKYYTSNELAMYCVNKTKEIIGVDNITEYLEPSAGGGVFLDYLDKPYLAYDITSEDNRIVEQDYLTLDLEYKQGRCIIGNPPYGRVNNLSVQFYKKSIQLGDYISFILPISQLNNNIKMYEFDMIYSEDLGIKQYSNKKVHCCLNIYKRPFENKLNKRPNYKLKDVEIKEGIRGTGKRNKIITKENFDYDIAICNWGNGTCGNIIEYGGQYSTELYIKIHNNRFKQQVISLIKDGKWKDSLISTGGKKIQIWWLYRFIKEQISEIN